jgi:hypothetical protein
MIPASSKPMRKVLIVTQRFYPDPTVAAVRVTQWAKWLPECGWKPIVACRNSGSSLGREEVASAIHPEVEVVYLNDPPASAAPTKKSKTGGLVSAAIRVIGPDLIGTRPRNRVLRWGKEAVTKLRASRGRARDEAFWRNAEDRIVELVRRHRPDAVITSSPPVAVHTAGLRLRKEFPDLCWLADFRDDYRQGGRYRVGVVERYGSFKRFQHESAIYRAASWITCALPVHQRWIRRRFPECADKMTIVLNGAPEELCAAARQVSAHDRGGTIKVIGFSEARESVALAQAVAALREAGEAIDLRFVGNVPALKPKIEEALGDNVAFTGPVPHDRALEEAVSARVLVAVLSENRSRLFLISSKLFEHLAVPAPVIVINPTRPDASLFSRLDGVWMLRAPTAADIRATLEAALDTPFDHLQSRALMVQERWNRRSQVQKLAAVLDDLCEARGRNTEVKAQERASGFTTRAR